MGKTFAAKKRNQRNRLFAAAAVAVALAAAGVLGEMALQGEKPQAEQSDQAARPSRITDTQETDELAELKGRWRRPDGGYVLEIRAIDAKGRVDAGYFNPNPIHVSRAEAALDRDAPRLFIELRDRGYPGATYRLAYHFRRDMLVGLYEQPAVDQTFEVVFVRSP